MPRRIGLVAVFVAAALLAWGTSASGGGTAAEKTHSEADRLNMWGRGTPAAIFVTRSVEGRGQPRVTLTYAFSGWILPDKEYTWANACEVPASSFALVTRGPGAGSGSLDVDLSDPRVRCGSSGGASRVQFRIESRPGGDSSDMHVTTFVETGGARYHVQGREQSWQVVIWVTLDGVTIGPFSPSGHVAESAVTSYRATRVEKAP